jgi:Leucine-rich repeat (LRR) protein
MNIKKKQKIRKKLFFKILVIIFTFFTEKNEINILGYIKKMTEFNIEEYLNSLPDDTTNINIFGKYVKYLPDLSRFKNLIYLNCSNNQLTSLPVLNENLKELSCSDNKLTSLPALNENLKLLNCSVNELTSLPVLNKKLKYLTCYNNELTSLPVLNEKLEFLNCSVNKLTSLPVLNETLESLYCSSNQLTSLPKLNEKLGSLNCSVNKLTSLPVLNENLKYLDCNNNKLTSLPVLNENLKCLYYLDNPIFEILPYYNFYIMSKNIKTLNNFRYLYYCLKYKKRLWKFRELIIMKKYHPDYLINLTEEDDLDEKLKLW